MQHARKRIKSCVKLKNKMTKCEARIEELEAKVETKEIEIASLDFSDKEHSNKALREFQELKDQLDKAMREWESVCSELEEIDSK